MISNKQAGFSTVELLVTLFVAAAFIMAGYQLYSLVINDGGAARAHSKASTVAQDYLNRYKSLVSATCSASQPLVDLPVSVNGLSDVKVSVDITCPNNQVTAISLVTVTVKYNDPEKTAVVSSYGFPPD